MADPTRVIVVDDEADLREMIAEYLGKYGLIVRTAGDGRELDAHLAGDPPDLLERNPERLEVIKTMRGAGYMFVPSKP